MSSLSTPTYSTRFQPCPEAITQSKVDDEQWERKTFRLTLSLFVPMCRESPSINNKNCCLRPCPKGLISSMDPWPCHLDGSLKLEPIARGQWLFVLYLVCAGSITTHNQNPHRLKHIIHISTSYTHAFWTLKVMQT